MKKASAFMLVLAVQFFMFFIEDSLAIQCYKCDNCNDPFVSTGVTTCTGKSCSKGKGTTSGVQYVTRDCSDSTIDSSLCADTTVIGIQATGCFCNTNLCNDSMQIGSLSGLILTLSIGSLVLLLKFH